MFEIRWGFRAQVIGLIFFLPSVTLRWMVSGVESHRRLLQVRPSAFYFKIKLPSHLGEGLGVRLAEFGFNTKVNPSR